jgi:hypothetical protein
VRTSNIGTKIAANEGRVNALNGKIDELIKKRDAVVEENDRLKTAAILAAASKKGYGFDEVISAIECNDRADGVPASVASVYDSGSDLSVL